LLSLFEAQSADSGVPIHAVYPHRRHLPSKVPAFVDFLIEKFTPPPWEI
jgi:DNA-binding transcriptional LysR family regulator